MLENLIDDKLITSDDRIAVGVSGGADSMLLLWALIDKQKKLNFYMHVINVNHNLRGAESDNDSQFVVDFCKQKKIPCTCISVDVKKLKEDEKKTLEESARLARYEAFSKVMKKEKLNKLFLAHHKNDQVETILMHIFRGSGIDGACGIRNNNSIIRPLLSLSKTEIKQIVKEHGIKFVEDSSNSDNSYTRNFLRNEIIPSLEKIYPGIVNTIFNFGEICSQVQTFIESQINLENIISCDDGVIVKNCVFDNPPFISREYLKLAFQKLNIFADIEQIHYQAIINLSKLEVNKKINLPHKLVARKVYEGIFIYKENSLNKMQKQYEFVIGKIKFSDKFEIETTLLNPSDVVFENGTLFVDYAKISNNAIWRTRKSGDQFAKLGTGNKKLNDYFTDKKFKQEERDEIPILVNENHVLVVGNYDISENVKIDDNSDQVVKIKIHRC